MHVTLPLQPIVAISVWLFFCCFCVFFMLAVSWSNTLRALPKSKHNIAHTYAVTYWHKRGQVNQKIFTHTHTRWWWIEQRRTREFCYRNRYNDIVSPYTQTGGGIVAYATFTPRFAPNAEKKKKMINREPVNGEFTHIAFCVCNAAVARSKKQIMYSRVRVQHKVRCTHRHS